MDTLVISKKKIINFIWWLIFVFFFFISIILFIEENYLYSLMTFLFVLLSFPLLFNFIEKKSKIKVKNWYRFVAIIILIIIFEIIPDDSVNNLDNEYKVPTTNYIEEKNNLDKFDKYSNTNEYHWDHMPLTYNLDSCINTFEGKIAIDINNSFIFISNRTDNLITFEEYKSGEVADITYICDIGGIETRSIRNDFTGEITEAEAIPNIYTDTLIFAPSDVYIYATYDCLGKRPTLIIHETLHLLNLDHNVKPSYVGDIMHPYISDNCDDDLLEKDINYLKEIYG